jgi:phytoene dehydrogenase-like protein
LEETQREIFYAMLDEANASSKGARGMTKLITALLQVEAADRDAYNALRGAIRASYMDAYQVAFPPPALDQARIGYLQTARAWIHDKLTPLTRELHSECFSRPRPLRPLPRLALSSQCQRHARRHGSKAFRGCAPSFL